MNLLFHALSCALSICCHPGKSPALCVFLSPCATEWLHGKGTGNLVEPRPPLPWVWGEGDGGTELWYGHLGACWPCLAWGNGLGSLVARRAGSQARQWTHGSVGLSLQSSSSPVIRKNLDKRSFPFWVSCHHHSHTKGGSGLPEVKGPAGLQGACMWDGGSPDSGKEHPEPVAGDMSLSLPFLLLMCSLSLFLSCVYFWELG